MSRVIKLLSELSIKDKNLIVNIFYSIFLFILDDKKFIKNFDNQMVVVNLSKISQCALLKIAMKVGTSLEFSGPRVREVGEKNWLRRRQMYDRLYARVRKQQKNFKSEGGR
ncbi:hypothetical protein ABEX25_23175 [Paenibacillus thiaminolyticus]|uniref:hypothetical protein n=1 Tax=Paenibacillus thiaminolyticus TaxID=49283 RepID=UPI003D2C402F